MTINCKIYCLGLLGMCVAAGCGASGPARSAVEGTVTVGGQPLPAGRVIFTPVGRNVGPAVTVRVNAGRYQTDKATGPVVGKNRVDVEADLDLGFALDDEEAFARRGAAPIPPSPIPPEFNVTAQLNVEIKPGEVNTYDIPVPAYVQTVNYR